MTTITLEELNSKVERLEALFEMLLMRNEQSPKASVGVAKSPESMVSALDFTAKQHAVIQMIHSGYTTVQMADTLDVAEGTIKVHISSIMGRMQMRSRTQIPAIYQEWMDTMPPDLYARQASIPMGWATDPSQHTETTSQLRIKLR
tara:strand:- start:1175 stop:1612 length:438 start_codon:yes stop_codon:yes gene_type:complete